MKVRKNAKQKNFTVDNEMYTKNQLKEMLEKRVIYWDDEHFEQRSDYPEWFNFDETHFIIFASDCNEIKVIYDDESEFYATVAITKTGEKIYITL